MMLNITHKGESTTYNLGDVELTDDEVLHVAEALTETEFKGYVIDRIGLTIYLRPKVPFGSGV